METRESNEKQFEILFNLSNFHYAAIVGSGYLVRQCGTRPQKQVSHLLTVTKIKLKKHYLTLTTHMQTSQ
jgi:hypothetical protein